MGVLLTFIVRGLLHAFPAIVSGEKKLPPCLGGTVLVFTATLGGVCTGFASHFRWDCTGFATPPKICHHTFVGNNENKRKRVGRYWDFLGLARQLLGNSPEAAFLALGNPSTSLLFSFH